LGRLVIQPGVFSGEVPPTKTVLRVLLELRHPVLHSCRRGLCGQDLIRILKGAEFLNPIDELEDGTLQLLQARDKPMRMACCVRVVGDGEVEVEIVK
jgi:ferredoxin